MEFVDDAAALASLEAALADNAYYVKYREKLAHSSVRPADVPPPARSGEVAADASAAAGRAPPPPRLDSGVDVAKLAQLDAAGVRRRGARPSSAGCVPPAVGGSDVCDRGRGGGAPVFLYPVPRGNAWALVVGEWRGAGTLQLARSTYQRRGAAMRRSRPCCSTTPSCSTRRLALMLGGAPRGAAGLDVRELGSSRSSCHASTVPRASRCSADSTRGRRGPGAARSARDRDRQRGGARGAAASARARARAAPAPA